MQISVIQPVVGTVTLTMDFGEATRLFQALLSLPAAQNPGPITAALANALNLSTTQLSNGAIDVVAAQPL